MSGPLVLVADNDLAVSSLLCDVLHRMGLTVRQVFDGEAASAEARAPEVAALVCDLDMPRMSGIEVLESLAAMASPPPAIVISGYLDQAIHGRLGSLGFVRAVLRKPFDLLAFGERVRTIATRGRNGPADGLDGTGEAVAGG